MLKYLIGRKWYSEANLTIEMQREISEVQENSAEPKIGPKRQKSMLTMHISNYNEDADNASSNGTMFSSVTRLTTDECLNRDYPILRRSPLCYGPKMSAFISGSLADAKSKPKTKYLTHTFARFTAGIFPFVLCCYLPPKRLMHV